MHAFIRGKDVGFSAERFYEGVADLLAGVEEEEGYVVDGKWVGWEGKEERKKGTMKALTNAEEAAPDRAAGADTLRRTVSDKQRLRMEEILRSTFLSCRSGPSSPSREEEEHLVVQRRQRVPATAAERDGPQDRDVALRRDTQKAVDQERIILDTGPENTEVRRWPDSQEREMTNSSTAPPPTQSQARSRETCSLPRL